MEYYARLKVEYENLPEAINSFLADILRKELVEAVFVNVFVPSGDNVVSALVREPEKLIYAAPLAPVMSVNSARLLSRLTKESSSPLKIAVVLRPCELRAFTELIKLKQASLENLVLISFDCPGTYSINDYNIYVKLGDSSTADLIKNFKQGSEAHGLRNACQVCEHFVPFNADITIELVNSGTDILLKAATENGKALTEGLETIDKAPEGRQEIIKTLVSKRAEKLQKLIKETGDMVKGTDNLQKTLAKCINCRNCKDICPICYCRECFFDSPVFEFKAEQYLGWAEKKGAIRMPTDTLLFHLTRLNHMVSSCVGCGMCSEACPNKLPVFEIFRMTGLNVQKTLEYIPGRSLNEELPLITFRENELETIGE